MSKICFTNARVVLADGVSEALDVVCTDGRIAEVRPRAGAKDGEVIDLGANYLAPGFVDLHIHGALGRDTMEGTADAFRTICDYHASGGTTSLLLTTATAPMPRILDVLRAARRAMTHIPQLAGVHVEGPFISRERPGAQRAEFISDPRPDEIDQLLEFSDVMKRLTLAPELPGAPAAIARLRDRNVMVSGGHSDAWDEDARVAFEHGMRHVTHTFNCMSSARRRGAERVAGLLEFALSEPEMMCELIADGHHVSPTLMKMLYRAKGPDGICLVTDATAGAGLPNGTHFDLAGHDCVVHGGVCWLADGSALAGSAARMIDLVRTLVRSAGVPLHDVINMATASPARALQASTKGKIEVGADADLVVFSAEFEVLQTFIAGRQVFAR
ncbi:MAG: N-acetylglucosamine-6-phosphate deacetylase [uncultured Chthoniobacterales bacterium]|uniref:N-acetylglucosamine-6-phosphate deacetylase n=1 Tax=uncultured Chthoniobacterales bacterium TaxID=1836801 RepID=A0A6J4HLB2_9BACT|nr:MAG: N-acetylglucosamine-6-phosphate deacetylase [uncultured Chthoniobacterales bacterium]